MGRTKESGQSRRRRSKIGNKARRRDRRTRNRSRRGSKRATKMQAEPPAAPSAHDCSDIFAVPVREAWNIRNRTGTWNTDEPTEKDKAWAVAVTNLSGKIYTEHASGMEGARKKRVGVWANQG